MVLSDDEPPSEHPARRHSGTLAGARIGDVVDMTEHGLDAKAAASRRTGHRREPTEVAPDAHGDRLTFTDERPAQPTPLANDREISEAGQQATQRRPVILGSQDVETLPAEHGWPAGRYRLAVVAWPGTNGVPRRCVQLQTGFGLDEDMPSQMNS